MDEDTVQALFAALPVVGENPVGRAARSIMVNRIKGATPGKATTPYVGVEGDTFLNIFFPNYSAVAFEDNVSDVTGLDGDFWSGMSIAVLCDAMYNLTSNLRPQMLIDKINETINCGMNCIKNSSVPWYQFLAEQIDNPIKTAYLSIQNDDRPQALQIYKDALKSPNWIMSKLAQYQSGNWPNAGWEMYHHWIKLLMLGSTVNDVNYIISYLQSQNLPIPDEVSVNNWQTYFNWFGSPVDWNDFRNDASDGILKEVCYALPGAVFPSCMQESNSYEFTANSQPGSAYREVPSSSCFRAGTKVLMADMTYKPIEQVALQDKVMTPNGTGTVLLISTPLRAGRTLYHFDGMNFEFSDTHPFLVYNDSGQDTAPMFACVDPQRLIENVPVMSYDGIVPLEGTQGLMLCTYSKDGSAGAAVLPVIPSQDTGNDDEMLYDLILDVEECGISAYYVGDGETQFGAASEIPQYMETPEASHALMLMLNGCYQTILDTMQSVSEQDFLDILSVGINSVATNLIPEVLSEIQTQPLPESLPGAQITAKSVHEMIRQMFGRFDISPEGSADNKLGDGYNQNSRFGNLYNTLAAVFGMPFVGVLNMGWRKMQYIEPQTATLLSVTPQAAEIYGISAAGNSEIKQMRVILQQNNFVYSVDVPLNSSLKMNDCCILFDQCAYFDMWRSDTTLDSTPWFVKFKAIDENKECLYFTKAAAIPQELNTGSSQNVVLLYDNEGKVTGQIYFDIRIMNEEIYAAELQAQKTWTQELKEALAQQLGTNAGEYINANFPAAVELFAPIASVGGNTPFGPVEQTL